MANTERNYIEKCFFQPLVAVSNTGRRGECRGNYIGKP